MTTLENHTCESINFQNTSRFRRKQRIEGSIYQTLESAIKGGSKN